MSTTRDEILGKLEQMGTLLNEAFDALSALPDSPPSPFAAGPTVVPEEVTPARELTHIERVQLRLKQRWDQNLEVDGDWGPISSGACREYLSSLMPSPHPFPSQKEVRTDKSPYGPRGVKDAYSPPMVKIQLPFPVYYGNKPRTELAFHPFCAQAFANAFQRLHALYPTPEQRRAVGIDIFDGIYNPRNTRGGSTPSMHSYACALDLDAEHNGNQTHWPTFSRMPLEVMECFALEGILPAGAFWNRDAMHFQATNA